MGEKFEIRDKRSMDSKGNPRTESARQPEETRKPEPHPQEKKTPRQEAAPHGESDFLSFVMNLAGMAYMTMGLGDMPTEPNLPEAKYIIDSLDMLNGKTKGNLTPDEENALRRIIYELKMTFSRAAGGARK